MHTDAFFSRNKKRLADGGLGISQIPKRLLLNTFSLLELFALLFIVLAVLLCIYIYKRKQKGKCFGKVLIKELNISIVYFVLFLGSYYSLSVAPGFPLRTWSTFIIFFIITILVIYRLIVENFDLDKSVVVNRIMICCLSIIIFGTYSNNYFKLRQVKVSYIERVAIITNALESDKEKIYLPTISSNSRYSCFSVEGDLTIDYNSWQNRGIARYYGLNMIIMKNDIE